MFGNLSFLDYAVMLVYLGGTLALGLYIGRRVHSGSDYFLAGKSLPWWVIGMSLVATDIGGTDIIGVGGASYTFGIAVGNFEWIGCVPAMVIAAFVFIPYFWRTGVYTIPEFMERRFNVAVRSALAFCWLVFMACNLGIMLYASAKMMTQAMGIDLTDVSFAGVDLTGKEVLFCILLTAAFVGIYTLAGGLAAVVYTDMVQCIVMIGGCLLVLVLGIVEVGGVSALVDAVESKERQERAAAAAADPVAEAEVAEPAAGERTEHLELILPVDTKSPFPWSAILFGLAMVLSPAYWIGNQAIVQRSLGAKTEFQAKASYIWGALLKNLIPVIIAGPGLVAYALYDLNDGDLAFPTLVRELLPVGLTGLFLSAFLAALMSSIDSYLNSAATILSNDLYKRLLRPSATDEQLLVIGRWTTIALVVWAIGFSLVVQHWDESQSSGIYAIFQTLMAFFQGPALAILITGLLWKRANGIGAFVGFVGGVAAAVGLFTLNLPAVAGRLGIQPLFQISDPFLYFSMWAFLVAITLIAIVSLLTPPQPEEQIRDLIYRGRRGDA